MLRMVDEHLRLSIFFGSPQCWDIMLILDLGIYGQTLKEYAAAEAGLYFHILHEISTWDLEK